MSLILLPIFMGFALIIFDLGRGNNAHSDLSAAADALALAGARELDGAPDAIERARAAMATLSNSVSMLGITQDSFRISLVYEPGGATFSSDEFLVLFLTQIPELDTAPLRPAYLASVQTTDPALARYVYVQARSQDLQTAFINPVTMLRDSVPIATTAVAERVTGLCGITPLYICNPFEGLTGYSGQGLIDRFEDGALQGRLLRLRRAGLELQPGTYGLLPVSEAGSGQELDMVAGAENPTCYDARLLDLSASPKEDVSTAINTKFDIYEGAFASVLSGQKDFARPAQNVRKGYVLPEGGGVCEAAYSTDPDDLVRGFPEDSGMTTLASGGGYGSGDWDLAGYWQTNYGETPVPPGLVSRHDVYAYELGNGLTAVASPGGEVGGPTCGPASGIFPEPGPDPRVSLAVVLDCASVDDPARASITGYARLFHTRPMIFAPDGSAEPGNPDTTMDVEIIGLSAAPEYYDGRRIVRAESVLVR